MNVLHLLDSLNRGGAETLVLDICRNAEKCGLKLTFAASGGGDLKKEFENSGVEFIGLQRRLPVDPNLIRQLRKIIKEKKIEIVHAHQPVEAVHLYLATAGLKNVKCVLSHHGGGLFAEKAKNRLMAKYLSPLMDGNISCSRSLLPWLREEIGIDTAKNFHIIYNGVDAIRLQGSGNSVREEFGIEPEDLLLGMIANFVPTPTKDQMTICRALPKVFAEFENAKFIFAGKVAEGGEKNFNACIEYCAEKGIGDKVFFPGVRNDVPDILAALDLFVFSSLHEGLPIAIVEAMMTKTPVIASDISPLVEATGGGKYAEIFKVKNSEDLAEKILTLLTNTARRENKAEKAYIFAKENYSIEAHIENLKMLYENLLND
ncbi:glycosyltransferase [soil metagenome]